MITVFSRESKRSNMFYFTATTIIIPLIVFIFNVYNESYTTVVLIELPQQAGFKVKRLIDLLLGLLFLVVVKVLRLIAQQPNLEPSMYVLFLYIDAWNSQSHAQQCRTRSDRRYRILVPYFQC